MRGLTSCAVCLCAWLVDGAASATDGAPADVSEKTLFDVYLKPWLGFVATGGRGIMMAHGEVGGCRGWSAGRAMDRGLEVLCSSNRHPQLHLDRGLEIL